MRHHVVLDTPLDLAVLDQDVRTGVRPAFALVEFARQVDAVIHQPQGDRPTALDRVRARLIGAPQHWALARRLVSRLSAQDIVFCMGEQSGVPVAALCGGRRGGPRVAVFVHHVDRPRARLALRLYRLGRRVDLFLACARPQLEFVGGWLGLPNSHVAWLPQPVDTAFFTPGASPEPKPRPLLVSAGREQRDYATLAHAVAGLDVDVHMTGFSQSAARTRRTAVPRAEVTTAAPVYHSWPDLRALYHAADLVIVSLHDNGYAAGVQAVLEGLACRRPVIVTRTRGLVDYWMADGITPVPPGNRVALREAIVGLLRQPKLAAAQAERGYAWVQARHTQPHYIAALRAALVRW